MIASHLLVALLAAAPVANDAAGITWNVPAEWKTDAVRQMRVATYLVPAAKGSSEGAEVAVFYFGEGGGGPVDDNVKRWVSQFTRADGSPLTEKDFTRKTEKVKGLTITTVDASGTFQGSGMMGPSAPKPNSRMLAAIIEGPKGPVFFKMTGPAATVTAAQKQFQALIKSAHTQG